MIRTRTYARRLEPLASLLPIISDYGAACWLVGGAVRDLLCEKPVSDFDLAIQGPVEDISRMFARRVGGTFFWLDEERGHARVVVKRESLVFDLGQVKGDSIEGDLRLRDFTINAMALPLNDESELLDPLGGAGDLIAGVIRTCGPTSLSDDPLRLLRGVRFAATMGFEIEPATWHDLVKNATLITGVAGERVRDEFFRILAVNGAVKYLVLLDEAGLLMKILPSCCRDDAFMGKVSNVENLVAVAPGIVPDYHEYVVDYLNQETEAGVTRLSLLKLAMILSDVGCMERVCDYQHLSTLSRRILNRIVAARGAFPASSSWAGRPLYRYFRDREPAGIEILMAELAKDPPDDLRWNAPRELITYFFTDYDYTAQALLLTGSKIMEILNLPAGPAVGKVMEELRAAEARGEIHTKEEAIKFLRKNQLTTDERVV